MQMPRDDEIRLAMGELSADQMRTAKAAIRWMLTRAATAQAVRDAALLPGLEHASRILHANFDGTTSAAPHYIDEAIRALKSQKEGRG